MYSSFGKRLCDLILALVGIFLLAPLLLLILLFLMLVNAGHPLFFQTRTGRGGRLFRLYKFKTMNDLRDVSGRLLPDKERMTYAGRILRSLSLDELPQLFNVLKGDMSLVGPRPLLPKYLPLYTDRQAHRHDVRPGITGWAQVNGRNAISWQERFELDVYYVEHLSLLLDAKIILLTLMKLIKRQGINAADDITMKPFTGN